MKRKFNAEELALAYELLAGGATLKIVAYGLGCADPGYLRKLINRCEREGIAWLAR
jgi:hypothetical protein